MTIRTLKGSEFPTRYDGETLLCRRPDCPVVIPAHRSFCSRDCKDYVWMRTSPSWLARMVFRRDKGICATCGLDTEWLRRIFRHAGSSYHSHWIWGTFERAGFNRNQKFWQADHIVEIINGGDPFDMANLQTLCVPCHKDKTRVMHAERAAQRKAQKHQDGLFA